MQVELAKYFHYYYYLTKKTYKNNEKLYNSFIKEASLLI